jgi:hypothetical protein
MTPQEAVRALSTGSNAVPTKVAEQIVGRWTEQRAAVGRVDPGYDPQTQTTAKLLTREQFDQIVGGLNRPRRETLPPEYDYQALDPNMMGQTPSIQVVQGTPLISAAEMQRRYDAY